MLLLCAEPSGTLECCNLEDIAVGLPEVEAVRVDALALPEIDRAALARDLLASLDGSADPDVAKAWDIELCRRINEIESGVAQLLDVDEVLEKARKKIAKG
ncbi:MAG: addiction module protein [Pseudomonadota bacterium]